MTNPRYLNPIIKDIETQYVRYRKKGNSRSETIEAIRSEYAQGLKDADDRVAILIGLSLALCKKNELLESIAAETLREMKCVTCEETGCSRANIYFSEIEKLLNDKTVYGDEAFYKRATAYVPDWEIGDVFSHVLTYPASEGLGITGWVILLYKVGEYVDTFDAHNQLMYISLCPSDKVPACKEDFEKLGFLPVMCMGNHIEYLAQITIKSKKAEDALELCKIGCFPDMPFPGNPAKENPVTAMPLFGRMRRTDIWLGYENQICSFYKRYGYLIKTKK